jgi:hypothetical protein
MGSSNGTKWILITVVVIACGYAYWYYFGLTIKEPPINKQILAQIDEMNGGDATPLPIPLKIGRTTFASLDMDAIVKALTTAGFVEVEAPELIPTIPIKGIGKKLTMNASVKMYSCEAEGILAVVMTKANEQLKFNTVAFATRDELDSLLASLPNIKEPEFKFSEKGENRKPPRRGFVGIGPLSLGMPESQVRRAVNRIRHDATTDPYSLLIAPEYSDLVPSSIAVGFTTAMKIYDDGSSTRISRGEYFYALQYHNNRLASIQITDVGAFFRTGYIPNNLKEKMLKKFFDEDMNKWKGG